MQTFGNYRLERLLGRGGMAEVFLARPINGPDAGKLVALKRLSSQFAQDPTYTDLFLGEADLNRTLVHPNIVRVVDSGMIQDTVYLAMEYIRGPDLGQVITVCTHRKVALPVELCCYVVHCLADALHFAHTARSATGQPLGIVHCDVTPSNVFLAADGTVKLGDFGVARTRAMGAALEAGLAGKPQYFAPELLLGEEADAASDVFSLGVIFYEMLTQCRPFDGRTYGEICDRIVAGKFERPSVKRAELTPMQEEVVLRALRRRASRAKEPTVLSQLKAMVQTKPIERYDTAADFAKDLLTTYEPRPGHRLALASVLRGLSTGAPRG